LGTLINFMGIRRVWTRGLKSANKFMIGAAIAYNLKKWLNYTEQKRKTTVMAIKRGQKAFAFCLLAVRCFIAHYNNKSSTYLADD
ncbi:MAG: hypothetical protein WKF91_02720, partial [Segetibacter sp.]